MISLLDEIWDEWLASPAKFPDLEVSGLLMGMKRIGDSFVTKRFKAARRLCALAKLPVSIDKHSVTFSCPPDTLKLPDNETIWAWLKGLWGSSGNLYFPKSGYYLSMNIPAAGLSKKTGLSWSVHKNKFVLRNHEDIMTFLYMAGMKGASLHFDSVAMIRSARNRANTASNYDTANITRAVKAAEHQRLLSKKILASGFAIPEKLRELAELRIKYPDETLSGLGEKLNPPVKKSTVKYRWNKLETLLSSFTSN